MLVVTVMLMDFEVSRPLLSVTLVTMVHVPAGSTLENEPPDPMVVPLAIHCNEGVRLPSWLSDAAPVNAIDVLPAKLAPLTGLFTDTLGAEAELSWMPP